MEKSEVDLHEVPSSTSWHSHKYEDDHHDYILYHSGHHQSTGALLL